MKELGRIITNQYGVEKSVFAPIQPIKINPANQIFTTDKKTVDVSWRTNFQRMAEIGQAWKEVYPYQDTTEVDVNKLTEFPKSPYLVWWMSDAHIGNVDCNYKALQKDIELVENTPNCGVITVGDDIDMGILPKLEVRFMQAMPVYAQAFTVEDLMAELNGRNPRERQLILAHVIGNHTHTLMEQSGILFEKFYQQSKAAILPGMGQVFLTVGDEKYEIGLAHRHSGQSRLNVTLAAKRLGEYQYPNADVLVVGHYHKVAHEEFTKGGKKHLAVRPGTYRVGTDTFEKARGWGAGELGGSCTVFFPDIHDFTSFDNLEKGVEYLSSFLL